MNRKLNWIVVLGSLIAGLFAANAMAGPNWRSLIPFEPRVEYDARKEYKVHQGNGPWMILAASFSGPRGLSQAQSLLKELRTRYNVQAYMHQRNFDFNEQLAGKGFAKGTQQPPRMMYRRHGVSRQYVILVGNFATEKDAEVDQVLEKLKYAWPKSLEIGEEEGTAQNLAKLRELQRVAHTNDDRRRRGPMVAAFLTRNPLLPKEYFNPKGINSFVYSLNKDIEHSLLKNRGRFTVKVASFRGASSLSSNFLASTGPTDKLHRAANTAHKLATALRAKGVEAYEFHDRHESIVTIGSFDRVGDTMPDGHTELMPAVYQLMSQFSAERKRVKGGKIGLAPRSLGGIPFDVQPVPIEVPKTSVVNDYSRGGQFGFLR